MYHCNVISHHHILIAVFTLLLALVFWAPPVLAEPTPPKIDWKELQDLLGGENPEHAVGEQMC